MVSAFNFKMRKRPTNNNHKNNNGNNEKSKETSQKFNGRIEEYDDDERSGKIVEITGTLQQKIPFESFECQGFFPKKGVLVTFTVIFFSKKLIL